MCMREGNGTYSFFKDDREIINNNAMAYNSLSTTKANLGGLRGREFQEMFLESATSRPSPTFDNYHHAFKE